MSGGLAAAAVPEKVEAAFMYQLESGTPAPVATDMGMASEWIGGGAVLAMRRDVTEYWNKALGFGFDEPVTAELIGRVCEFYREHDAPMAVLQLAPAVLPDDWDDIRARYGLEPGGAVVKSTHDLVSIDPPKTDLRIGEVDVHSGRQWASTLLRAFGMPEEGLAEMNAAAVGSPGFRCYAAWDGDEIVAVGGAFVHGDVAELWGGATLPSHQRRGAQSSLLAIRLLDAKAAGCRMAVVETGAEGPGERNQSFHNVMRLGFSPQYERRNWVWRPARQAR
ncbi:GNAT family N-acetyltransferase [Pseudonocardia sp. CA-142604]|uniref:GNAT family N-acetyltransferase n=1 Tax=Pseudonocardia sp. CA-142604 TaxID=3240024 RepID=UPI003D934D60